MLVKQKEYKKEVKSKQVYESLVTPLSLTCFKTPQFVSAMIFSAAIPHSLLLYPMIWNDACSEAFFTAFEISLTWIACLNALEVSTLCISSLGGGGLWPWLHRLQDKDRQ